MDDHDVSLDPRAARSRLRALDAAQQLLVQVGIEAVTHQRVAEHAGLGRRTLYRHWADRRSLLHDVLAQTAAPVAPAHGSFRDQVTAHLRALNTALNDGPLAYIVAALYERAVHDDEFDDLRATLVDSGCAPLKTLLRTHHVRASHLDEFVAALEGPIFYNALLHRRPTPNAEIQRLADRCITAMARPAREPGSSANWA